MARVDVIWTDDLVAHLEEHGISQEDFEHVLSHPTSQGFSRSTGLPAAWGYTRDGRYIIVTYEQIDRATVLPVTAYEVPEPR